MTTGEGADGSDARDEHDRRPGRGDRINVGGGDDSVVRIQLAARWAEAYGRGPDSLAGVLKRFRAAYEYLDAVTHSIEPPDLQDDLTDTRAAVAATGTPPANASASPTQAQIQPQPAYGQQPEARSTLGTPPEPRPWG